MELSEKWFRVVAYRIRYIQGKFYVVNLCDMIQSCVNICKT